MNRTEDMELQGKYNSIHYDRIRIFMEHHSVNEEFTKQEYIQSFDNPPSKITAQTDISRMIELGLCIRIGKGPSTKYKIIDRF